ncbi:MAG: class I SAM-dependent methyltransferase [Saprospiraceae bacterium]|uniref:Class I SAM-dependent methyltransferase n=1 Tax=Candidatus Opimibacter skivensis TaxID=2982028 RepID=A0A9D7SV70_9BACT|nr:class I SAM-dependent methyltransferase [Candidatus Opimibacter skivensis]
MSYTCTICDNTSDYRSFSVKEMQLGMREEFQYVVCNNCHSIQIGEIPRDLGKYYPDKNYYSFSAVSIKNKLFSAYFDIVSKSSFYRRGLFYRLIDKYALYDYSLLSIGRFLPAKNARILDVGSGAGHLLYMLKKIGYTDLTGIDPFIKESIYPVDVRRINLEELPENEMFDLIMFHHSFEHTSDPVNTLRTAKKHLKENGTILIRTPLVSYAFERYAENWFQLDAPRHIHLQSLEGIKIMLDKAGLHQVDIYCDSRDEQFYVSENYIHDIAMSESKKGPLKSLLNVLFSGRRASYRNEARRLNESMKGDTVVYYCRNK